MSKNTILRWVLAFLFTVVSACGQTTVFKNSKLAGGATVNHYTRNGSIYLVFPPGTSSADYSLIRAAGSVWDNSLIDGVTTQVNFNSVAQINTGSVGGQQFYIPSTSPTSLGNCNGYTADTDQCIKLSGAQVGSTFFAFASPIYYPFSWSTRVHHISRY